METTKRENRLFLSMIILYFIVNIGWGFLPIQNTIFMQRLTVLMPEFTMLIPAAVFIVTSNEKWQKIIRFRGIPAVTILLLIIMTFTLIPFISLCNAFSMLFATNLIQDEIGGMLTGSITFGLFSMALVPAIVEEMTYRGILCQKYIKINWRKGVILSGFLFGIMHMNFNQFFYAFIMGIIFAIIVEMTDSILGSMIVHFVFNGSSVVLSFFAEWLEKFIQDTEPTVEQMNPEITLDLVLSLVPAGVISFIISMMILVLIGKITGRLSVVMKLIQGGTLAEESEMLEDSFVGTKEESKILEDSFVGTKEESKMLKDSFMGIRKGVETIQTEETTKKLRIWSWPLIIGIVMCILMALFVEIVTRM